MKDVVRRKIVLGTLVCCLFIIAGMVIHDSILKQRARVAYAQHNQAVIYNNVSNLIFTTDSKKKEIIQATRYGYWNGSFWGSLELKK